MNKLLIIGALPESITNFRGELIRSIVEKGHLVTAMAADASQPTIDKINSTGATFMPYPIERNGLNPAKDLKTFFSLKKAIKKIKPNTILAYTIKPVIWGGIAARADKKIKFYALITGLGFAFQGKSITRKLITTIVSTLYKLALKNAEAVIFQNKDDLDVFVSRNIVPTTKAHIANGSGVDTNSFLPAISQEANPTFLTIARMLAEKGLRVYAEAARKVKQKYPYANFRLLGAPDPSPDGISIEEVMSWNNENIVEYLGETNDVRPYIAACHIFVLASYYGEGLPRTIIEAMAMGKPILTTDNVGCRETVISGENGFLVPIKDSDALAEKMIWFIEHQQEWQRMSDISRKLAIEKYDVKTINSQMLEIMGLQS